MADIGYLSLLLGLAAAIFAIGASVYGARRRYPELVASGEQAAISAAGLTALASGILVLLFLVEDYQVNYVAEHSSRDMPLMFRLSAIWSGQEGSLLWWAFILALYTVVAIVANRHTHRAIMPYATATLMFVLAFFLSLVTFVENPFRLLTFVPNDGNGLNPLLQHWAMAMHPPMLYLGYVGTAVPFAFAVGALASGRLGSEWVQLARRWTLAVWAFLTIGIMLGGAWAYMELGWGGYWGWDPVENASFLPWLAGTAFLHSIIIQERRGMLKVWNMVLVALFFGLAIFGTFLTRSGVISSVHSFAQSPLGPYFLAFMTVTFLGFLWLLVSRWPLLKADHQLESVVSRESSFLMNNLLLLAITFAVLWGTIFPMISEIVVNDKITVGPPFFNQTTMPIFAALLILMGIGPLTSWGRASVGKLVRQLVAPCLAMGVVVGILFLLGVRSWALFGYAIVIFVLTVHAWEFYQGSRVRRRATGSSWPTSLAFLFRSNPRRYGGYVVHLGILIMAAGIIASNSGQLEHQETLARGAQMQVGDYTLTYAGMQQFAEGDKDVVRSTVTVTRNGAVIDTLYPSRDFYRASQQPQTEVAIRRGVSEDLYIVLGGWEDNGATATFKAYVNPLVNWIWFGGLVVFAGVLLAAWPGGRRQRATVALTKGVPAR